MLRLRIELGDAGRRGVTLSGRAVAALAVFAIALVGASAVSFGAGGSSDKIHACVKSKGGAVRIVKASKSCRGGERRVSWSRVGPIGPTGAAGPQGVAGGAGADGAPGTTGPQGIQGPPGVDDFGDLDGMPCSRDAQTGAIELVFGAGGFARPRCVLPGDGPVCGDGAVEGAEVCDDGNGNPTDSCTNTCTSAICGDGVRAASEECDSGGTDSATCDGATCTFAFCGDGTLNAARGESCDTAGSSATCDDDCSVPACGDGEFNPLAGEQCDDGNVVAGDGCSNICQFD